MASMIASYYIDKCIVSHHIDEFQAQSTAYLKTVAENVYNQSNLLYLRKPNLKPPVSGKGTNAKPPVSVGMNATKDLKPPVSSERMNAKPPVSVDMNAKPPVSVDMNDTTNLKFRPEQKLNSTRTTKFDWNLKNCSSKRDDSKKSSSKRDETSSKRGEVNKNSSKRDEHLV
jgi:hypothetical protein